MKILGHNLQKQILDTAIKNSTVSHGYIFYGLEGIGKFALAKEFSQKLICENKTGCGICPKCKQFEAKTVSDFQIIDLSLNKEGEQKNSISVDETRELISDIYLKPFIFDKKIYIINNADKMTVQAQNALLKIFEEPPSYAIIILIVNNISNILPTILSRGVQIRFNPLPPVIIKEYIKTEFSKTVSDDVITNANGSLKNAINIVNSENYNTLRQNLYTSFINMCTTNKKSSVTELYNIFIKNENEINIMLDILSSFVYDIINRNNKNLIKNRDLLIKINLNLDTCYKVFTIINNLSKRLSTNASYNLSVFASLLEINKAIGDNK